MRVSLARPQHERVGLILLALLAFAATMTASKSADCGPGDKGKVPPLSRAALVTLATQAGFQGAAVDVAVAIALAESGGYPEASGDPLCGASLGLWQVNVRAHPQYKANPDVLFDPATNAKAAYEISKGGLDWSPWSTYTSKAYLAFMPKGSAVT